ncbi:MAG: YegS/Rv2252/BmrU family lipid kinase [Clostridiales bacterium]|nr:YegS/Rv2252/BmrU family lipid kinase [Clostridiales bacterium]
MKKLKLIYNPNSGDKTFKQSLDDCVRVFQDSGYAVDLLRAASMDALGEHISEMRDYDRVIVSGGDGSVNLALNAMINQQVRVPLGVIPAGAANDFASFLKTPPEPAKAAEALMRGSVVDCDIGQVNERYFINVCAAGLFSNISTQVDNSAKDVLGKFAYYLKALSQLSNVEPIPIRIVTSTETIDEEVYLFIILNTAGAGGFDKICPAASIQDGLFEFIALRAKPVIELTPLLIKIFRGDVIDDNAVLHLRDAYFYIECRTESSMETDVDGEEGPKMPIEVTNHKQSFPIILPEIRTDKSEPRPELRKENEHAR